MPTPDEPTGRSMPLPGSADLHAELVAVVLTVGDDGAYVLAPGSPARLPSGPLRDDHTSLQEGVRAFAAEQTGQHLGFVEQLYTFADLGRAGSGRRAISMSYLGLTREVGQAGDWQAVSALLPWEDHRDAAAQDLAASIAEALQPWVAEGGPRSSADAGERAVRVAHLFGTGDQHWRPELALQRYELLWEAGLVAESPGFAAHAASAGSAGRPDTGPGMTWDHRRILATALSRVRAKLQYAPVVVELMAEEFTLGELQETVEALVGQHVHKQNFRRSVKQADMVEATGGTARRTGGRPAQLYRFRDEVLLARQQVGTKVPIPRSR